MHALSLMSHKTTFCFYLQQTACSLLRYCSMVLLPDIRLIRYEIYSNKAELLNYGLQTFVGYKATPLALYFN